MNFQNFVGNNDVKAAVTAAFTQNRLPQTIIIQGEEGLGKKTFAKLIAQIAVCTSKDKPCGHCKACVKALAGSHPDIRTQTGSGASGNISVEVVRNIIEDIYKKPEEADMNIYLLFVKTRLLESSQNKLLKIIEEPPGNALFIITIESAETLLPTVRSRARCFTLSAPSIEEAAEFVAKESKISYDDALELANLHRGNIGKMLGGNAQSLEIAIKIAQLFDSSDEDSLLAISYPLIKSRDLFYSTMQQLAYIFRDAYNYNVGTGDCLGVSPEQSKRISNAYRKKNLIFFPSICMEYGRLAKQNCNMNLLVTSFCAKLREKALG